METHGQIQEEKKEAEAKEVQPVVKVTATVSYKKLLRSAYFHVFKNKGNVAFWAVTCAILVVSLIIIFVLGDPFYYREPLDMFFIILAFVLLGIVLLYLVVWQPVKAKLLLKSHEGCTNNLSFFEDHLFQKLTTKVGVSESTVSYQVFHIIYETKTAFYLYTDKVNGILLTKDSFDNPQDVTTLMFLLQKKMPLNKFKMRGV